MHRAPEGVQHNGEAAHIGMLWILYDQDLQWWPSFSADMLTSIDSGTSGSCDLPEESLSDHYDILNILSYGRMGKVGHFIILLLHFLYIKVTKLITPKIVIQIMNL